MSIYLDLLILAGIVVYIVDLSGFTDAWLRLLSKALGGPVTSLRPFSCGACMTWWCGLAYAAICGEFTLPVVGYCAALAWLSKTIYHTFVFIQQWTLYIIAKIMPPRW